MLITSLSNKFAYWLDHDLSVYWSARYGHIRPWLDPQAEDVLLDIGCGIGRWSGFFAPLVRSSYAFDVATEGLSHIDRQNIPILLTCASALAIPHPNETFSKIISVDVIEHVPDDRQMLNEVLRVLRPGGRVVITTLLKDRPHYIRRMEFDDHLREYDADMLAGLFERSGLRVEQVFYFYYAQGMLAREIQAIAQQISLGQSILTKIFAVGFLLMAGVLCRLLADTERIFPLGKPGGVGLVATKDNV